MDRMISIQVQYLTLHYLLKTYIMSGMIPSGIPHYEHNIILLAPEPL
jgi:hypothetical protein